MSRRLRIAHLSFTALPATIGGLEVVVDSLIRRQQAEGHEVSLVTRWQQWRACQKVKRPYPVLPVPPYVMLSRRPFRSVGPRWPVAAALRWHQWRHRFDIWHVHLLYPTGWMAYDALTRVGVPVVMTAHGADLQVDKQTSYGFRQFARHDRRVRELVPQAKVLTAISNSMVGSYRELGVDPSRIFRIPNGVDAERIGNAIVRRREVRDRLGIAPETALILSVGRNEPRKGFQFVPETLSTLVGEGRDVCWMIVGKDSAALLPAMQAAGVTSHVRLLPPIGGTQGSLDFPPDELAELFGAADILAVPSMSEGLGLVAIEAMAAGTPVIGNHVPGIRDFVADGIDGLLCPPRNPQAMAAAIRRVLDDEGLAERLASAGLEKAKEHDWKVIVTRYLDLYRSVLSGAVQ